MELPGGLIDAGSIEQALKDEISDATQMLPESPLDRVGLLYSGDLAHWIEGRISGTFDPAPGQWIAASKFGHGVRPLSLWPLPERVLYRALVERLEPSLERGDRHELDYREFLIQPVDRSAKYVLTADITAFYQYIDHGILEEELLSQTGQFTVVRAVTKLLAEITGRNYGLPQQSSPSDLLADVYIDQVERKLLRRGFKVWRYNDDFRFSCKDWPGTIAALEQLEETCRAVGLVLNESKTIPYKMLSYISSITHAESLRRTVADDAGLSIPGVSDDYVDETEGEEEVIEPDADAALSVLQEWRRIAGNGSLLRRVPPEHYSAVLFVLRYAFRHLAADEFTSPEAVKIAISMLRYEQQLTPSIVRFLGSRTGPAQLQVVNKFTEMLAESAYFTQWQSMWLASMFADNTRFAVGRGKTARLDWASALVESVDTNEAVRASTALMLAKHGKIDESKLLELYDRTGPSSRPYIVAALGFSHSSGRGTTAAVAENLLQELVYAWALSNVS